MKKWYDRFTFGEHTDIYNPWSIASFIGKKGKYRPYWSNTSGSGLVNSLIQKGTSEIKQTMEELLKGKSFEAMIDEQIIFSQLDGSANAVWSLLLAAGYLKVLNLKYVGEQKRAVRESGFGRYDIMLAPAGREQDCAYIIEFKVHKPLREKDLAETVANARAQIEEKQYEAELISKGFTPKRIRKYGFAFKGKECLIG